MKKTMPNAATEPSRQRKTSKPLSMLNALIIPTAPAIKQPRTAKPTTVSALEPRSDAVLGLSVCAWALIFVLWASRIDQEPAVIPPDSQHPVSAPHFAITAPPPVAPRNKL